MTPILKRSIEEGSEVIGDLTSSLHSEEVKGSAHSRGTIGPQSHIRDTRRG